MKCKEHLIEEGGLTWASIKTKLTKLINGDNGGEEPCPLCILEHLSELDGPIGISAGAIINKYNNLVGAIEDFNQAVSIKDIENIKKKNPAKNKNAVIDPIGSLDLPD
jgi:hypothetical protein